MSKGVEAHVRGAAEAPPPPVRLLKETAEVEPLLEARRDYAAPVYGYLEPRFFPQTRWYLAEGSGEPALLLQVGGLAGASLYWQGSTEGLERICREARLPRHSYITFEERHQGLVAQRFFLRGLQPLLRMSVDAASFRSIPSTAQPLSPVHLHQVNRLYRRDGGIILSRYPLVEGDYYGIWEGKELVSIAGTQMVSPRYGVAVVANVLTHPDYRGRGYATRCVGALTAALLGKVRDVVLNVDPENTPAVRAYRRLGYQERHRLAEAWAVWKGQSLLERALAAVYDWFSR